MTRAARRIADPRDFGRVAVLMGGTSSEREVSLDSGRNVLEALLRQGVDATAVDGIPALARALTAAAGRRYDRVFNILHGNRGGGEDGVLQGLLAALGVPYTGSGVLGSALSMDKIRTKQVWLSLGLPTPAYASLERGDDVVAAAHKIGLPVIVKPACEGSSVGVSRCFKDADLADAAALAARYEGALLVEQLIQGEEYTVAVLGTEALPSIRIVPAGDYYDYHAKYVAEDTQYLCPGASGATEQELGSLALAAFFAAACSGWGRVDFMRDRAGRPWLLEVNTAPGMTSHSLVPKAARQRGIEFDELVWRVLETSVPSQTGGGRVMLFWKKRNRRQVRKDEPSLLERTDWRAVGNVAGLVALCAVLAVLLVLALDRPVQRVIIEGSFQRVARPEIEAAVVEVVQGGLASVDLVQVRERIEQIDWVDRAVVQRRWPDALRVLVTEQVAAAQWNDAGLLNTRGELFLRNARYVPPELPLLEGPEGSEGAVAQLYLDAQGRLLEAGLRLTGVRLDERGAWELRLDNGVAVKLGRLAVTERLERFIRLASPLVAKRSAEVAYVDMRYTNGFSVGWNSRSAVAAVRQEDATPDA